MAIAEDGPSGFDDEGEEINQLLTGGAPAQRTRFTRQRLLGGGGLCIAIYSAAFLLYGRQQAIAQGNGAVPAKDGVAQISGAVARAFSGAIYDPAGAAASPSLQVPPPLPLPTAPPLPEMPTLPIAAPMRFAAGPPLQEDSEQGADEAKPAEAEASNKTAHRHKKHSKKEAEKHPKKEARGDAKADEPRGLLHHGRRGSFLVIGDWGYDDVSHGNVNDTWCQQEIGRKMSAKMKELGDVKFIINVGDSFYPSGVKSKDDPQWDTKWRNRYDNRTRSVPWYSVYGNHDYHIDPCACSSDPNDCAQVNWEIDDLNTFYMPGYNWYKEHPEFDLEVVGLDMNKFFSGWNRSAKVDELSFGDCQWSPCEAKCLGNGEARATQAFELFAERFENSKAKNLIVFSHYPTDYFSSVPEFLRNLSTASNHDIVYFGGHRHNVDNVTTWNIAPNNNFLVGGGGGWSCDGKQQGFLVATIDEDYNIELTPELVDYDRCCPPPPKQPNAWAKK
mmetsp:Transcript_120327/g.236472  ORF Transcript_120327/g.236472 Transcript_120327/m.236472 type:complete len:502 (+) Transcript_120327:94-1599(+)